MTQALLTAPSAATRRLATFWLGELMLGIEISHIREINRLPEITPVPDASDSVRGVINLRGDVVTVLGLRRFLGLADAPITAASRLVIVQGDGEQIGLLVDRVTDVMTLSLADAETLPANVGDIDSRFFKAVYKLDDQLLVELDVAATLAAE